MLQHDLGVQDHTEAVDGHPTSEWYGVNQYLFYKINCCWTAGVRMEWFHDNEGYVVTGLRPGNPLAGNFFDGDFYELSGGLNYKHCNWTVRPELRYDWFTGHSTTGADRQPVRQQHQEPAVPVRHRCDLPVVNRRPA